MKFNGIQRHIGAASSAYQLVAAAANGYLLGYHDRIQVAKKIA